MDMKVADSFSHAGNEQGGQSLSGLAAAWIIQSSLREIINNWKVSVKRRRLSCLCHLRDENLFKYQ